MPDHNSILSCHNSMAKAKIHLITTTATTSSQRHTTAYTFSWTRHVGWVILFTLSDAAFMSTLQSKSTNRGRDTIP